MLEFLLLAVLAVAVVAINKANGAMKENAALKLELERMRSQLERKPASKEEDSRDRPAADAGAASHVAGQSRTPTVPIIPQRAPEARGDDTSTAAPTQAPAQAADKTPDIGLPGE